MTKEEKWIDEYINNTDLNNIEWINLDAKELYYFFYDNYLDKILGEYVHDNIHSYFQIPIGMHYLTFDSPINEQNYNFFLGIVNNSLNKKTIVGAIIYNNKYYLFNDNKIPLTYISTVEINYYFRKKGLFKTMCENFYNVVDHNQHILTTVESDMGKQCKALEIFKNIFQSKGFKKYILEDQGYLTKKFIYDNQYRNDKVLKK